MSACNSVAHLCPIWPYWRGIHASIYFVGQIFASHIYTQNVCQKVMFACCCELLGSNPDVIQTLDKFKWVEITSSSVCLSSTDANCKQTVEFANVHDFLHVHMLLSTQQLWRRQPKKQVTLNNVCFLLTYTMCALRVVHVLLWSEPNPALETSRGWSGPHPSGLIVPNALLIAHYIPVRQM